jgi:hypothetical protein
MSDFAFNALVDRLTQMLKAGASQDEIDAVLDKILAAYREHVLRCARAQFEPLSMKLRISARMVGRNTA